MYKGKFSSLIMLGAFSAGFASSSVVSSAQGNENLAIVENKGIRFYDDSVTTEFKVSNESASVAETSTDEETQNASTDDNNKDDLSPDVPNDPGNGDIWEKDNETSEKEKTGGFLAWYKNNLGVTIPLTIFVVYFLQAIIRIICLEICQCKFKGGIRLKITSKGDEDEISIKPFFGLFKKLKKGSYKEEGLLQYDNKDLIKYTVEYRGLDRIKLNALAAFTLAKYDWKVGVDASAFDF